MTDDADVRLALTPDGREVTAFARAMELHDQGRLKEAVPFFRQALEESPEDLNVIYRAILTLVSMRDYEGCARWLTDLLPHINAAATEPWLMSGFYYNLGVAHDAMGRWDAASSAYISALSYDGKAILPRMNLGGICYRLGRHDDAKGWHDQVFSLPHDTEARPTVGLLRLLYGDYLKGFEDYERRWKLPQILNQSYIPPKTKRWHGETLEFGKRLLVVAEQGVGDVLMMSRYIPLLEGMGLRPILIVHAGLVRLMSASFPNCEVYAMATKHPPAGWWVPMLSLPRVFRTTLETIPDAKCLTLPKKSIDELCLSIINAASPTFRVGYVQRGNHLHMGDKDRSCHDDAAWQALLDTPNVEFVNLDEKALKDRYGIRDFADTASIIAQCDLVISVDSAVAHCAGALGKPVWLLPPAANEWRWSTPDRIGNDWYPKTHTLYRRSRVDAWPEVIQRVRHDLEAR